MKFAGPIPHCLSQDAVLVDFTASDHGRIVTATYAITCDEGWKAWGGEEDLLVQANDGAVKLVNGVGIAGDVIGSIPFAKDGGGEVTGRADIAIEHSGEKVLAHVKTVLDNHMIVDWGKPVLDGRTFYLDAKADISLLGAPISAQAHTYKLLPLEAGEDRPVPFEQVDDAAFAPALFAERQEIVVRSQAE